MNSLVERLSLVEYCFLGTDIKLVYYTMMWCGHLTNCPSQVLVQHVVFYFTYFSFLRTSVSKYYARCITYFIIAILPTDLWEHLSHFTDE